MEIIKLQIKGIYRDELTDVTGQLIYQSDWKRNTIVESCRIFLAKVMSAGDIDASPLGIQSLAVGRGQASWDTDGTPPSTESQTQLVDTAATITALTINYLDSNDEIVPVGGDLTSRIQIRATLEAGEALPLREFGLIGQVDNQNHLLNYVTHPVIHKDQLTTLTRTIRLYF